MSSQAITLREELNTPLMQAIFVLFSASVLFLLTWFTFINHWWLGLFPSIASICLSFRRVKTYHQAPLEFFGKLTGNSFPNGYYLVAGIPIVGGFFQFFGIFPFWTLGEQVSIKSRSFAIDSCIGRTKDGVLVIASAKGSLEITEVSRFNLFSDSIENVVTGKVLGRMLKTLRDNTRGELFGHSFRYPATGELMDMSGNKTGSKAGFVITSVREFTESIQSLYDTVASSGGRREMLEQFSKEIDKLKRDHPNSSDQQILSLYLASIGKDSSLYSIKFE